MLDAKREIVDSEGTRWVHNIDAETYQAVSPDGDASVPMPAIVFEQAFPKLYELFENAVNDQKIEAEDDHEHFEIVPPDDAKPACPECQNIVTSVAICTHSEECLALPCEHELTMKQLNEMTGVH